MSKIIIGLAGRKQVGKSTAAEYLVDCGFERHSFAAPLKNMVKSLLTDLGYGNRVDFLMDEGKEFLLPCVFKSPRWMMQTLGTEWGRTLIDPDLWIEVARRNISKSRCSVVFDDIRFENEAWLIRSMGGFVIHIDRESSQVDSHVSEAGINRANDDRVVVNAGSITDFLADINATVAGFIGS
jgi:hypothetical protein